MITILHIEDDQRLLKALTTLLRSIDSRIKYITEETIDGGLKHFEELKDDPELLIILDGSVGDPGKKLNTTNLIKKIRQQGFTGELIAASGDPGNNEEMLAAGATQAINKIKLPQEFIKRFQK